MVCYFLLAMDVQISIFAFTTQLNTLKGYEAWCRALPGPRYVLLVIDTIGLQQSG